MPFTLKSLVVTKGYLNKLAGLYELLFTNRHWRVKSSFNIFLVNPLVHAVLKGHSFQLRVCLNMCDPLVDRKHIKVNFEQDLDYSDSGETTISWCSRK